MADELHRVIAASKEMLASCVAQRAHLAQLHTLADSDPESRSAVDAQLRDLDEVESRLRTRIKLLDAAVAMGGIEDHDERMYNEDGEEVFDIREEYHSEEEADMPEGAQSTHELDGGPEDAPAQAQIVAAPLLSEEDKALIQFLNDLRFDSDDPSDDNLSVDTDEFDVWKGFAPSAPEPTADSEMGDEAASPRKKVRFSGKDEVHEIHDAREARETPPISSQAIVSSVVERAVSSPLLTPSVPNTGVQQDPPLDIELHMREIAAEYASARGRMVSAYGDAGFPKSPAAPRVASVAEDEAADDLVFTPALASLDKLPVVIETTKRLSRFKAMRQQP